MNKALDILDVSIERAHEEVNRLVRKVENHEHITPRIPSIHAHLYLSNFTDDVIALHTARAVEGALRGAWADVERQHLP